MLLSAVSVLVVAQSRSEIPEGLMNNPVYPIYTVDIVEDRSSDPNDIWQIVQSMKFITHIHISILRVKKNQLDAQLILSTFRQSLHVSGVSRPIIRRYNHMLPWLDCSNPTRATDSHLRRIISTSCCIHTFVPPDDGPRYARNM